MKNIKTLKKRNTIYKILAFAFAAFLFVMPTNLNALPDTDLRAIVTTLGVDLGDNSVVAYASVILPATGQSSTKFAKGEGITLKDAVKAMTVSIGKKLELGQCELVVIGNNLACSDNYAPLEYLLSAGTVGAEAAVVYAKNIEEFILGAHEIESNAVTGLNSFVIYSRDTIYSPSISMLDLLSSLKSKSKAAYVPQINITKNDGEAKIESINSAIALDYNARLVYINNNVAKGITWLDRFSNKGLAQLENFEYNNLPAKPVAADLKHKKTRLSAKFIDGKPTLKIKLTANLTLSNGSFFYGEDNSNKILDALKLQFTQKIQSEIQNTINFSKTCNSDFLQLTEEFYRSCPKQLNNYQGNLLQDLTVIYDMCVTVKL